MNIVIIIVSIIGWIVTGFIAALIDKHFEGEDYGVLGISICLGPIALACSILVMLKYFFESIYDNF